MRRRVVKRARARQLRLARRAFNRIRDAVGSDVPLTGRITRALRRELALHPEQFKQFIKSRQEG